MVVGFANQGYHVGSMLPFGPLAPDFNLFLGPAASLQRFGPLKDLHSKGYVKEHWPLASHRRDCMTLDNA
jgi:hypothetical protein